MSEDRPSRAELEADEYYDPLEGMSRCRYGCRVYFHGPDTTGARGHYEEVHTHG